MSHRWYREMDWVLLGAMVLLSGLGILAIWSATGGSFEPGRNYFVRQSLWLGLGVGAFLGGYFLDHRVLHRRAYIFYGVVFALLLLTLAVGWGRSGVHRWITMGPLTLQPSELAKLALIIALARYFQEIRARSPYGLRDLLVPLILTGGYVFLVAAQPDLGTALFTLLIAGALILLAGVRLSTILLFAGAAGVTAPLLFFNLREYQQQRILTFLDPGKDPLGTGYHVVQSKIAIGSGGLFGKGLLQGTQSQLQFIPEQHTDFIFSVIAEELGFLGSLAVVALVVFITLWLFNYFAVVKNRFAILVVMGVGLSFAFQAFINMAMTSGYLPVVGIPLPLVSYGGSSLATTFFAFGLAAGFRRRTG